MKQEFQVIIVGAGITGLATALHLRNAGVKSIAISRRGAGSSASASGLITGGMIDNYTRVSHAHGVDFAADLWRFGDQAFDRLLAFAKTQSCLLYTSPSPRDRTRSRMPSSA